MKSLIFLLVALMMVAPVLADTQLSEDADEFYGVLTFNLTACDDWTDGNYSTPCNDGSGLQNNYSYMNYTIPEGADISSYWNVDGSKTTYEGALHVWMNYSIPQDCLDYAVDEKLRLIYYTFGEYADGGCDYVLSCIGDNESFPEIMYEAYDTGGVYCGMWDEQMLWNIYEEPSKYAYLEDVGNGISLFLYYTGEAVARFVLFLGLVAGVTSIIYAVALLVRGIFKGSSK